MLVGTVLITLPAVSSSMTLTFANGPILSDTTPDIQSPASGTSWAKAMFTADTNDSRIDNMDMKRTFLIPEWLIQCVNVEIILDIQDVQTVHCNDSQN